MYTRVTLRTIFGLVLAACLLTPAVAGAQGFGIKGGMNSATFLTKPDNPDLTKQRGFVFGFYGAPKAEALFEWQTEILYSIKGTKFANNDDFVKIHYITVPILARIKLTGRSPVKVHVLAGPELAFRMKVESSAGGLAFDKDDVKIFDFGLSAGADIEVGHLVVDGRYTWGTINILKHPAADASTKNRALTIMVGIRFRSS